MDKKKKLFYTIIGAISALAAATAAFLALKSTDAQNRSLLRKLTILFPKKSLRRLQKEEPQAEVTADELAEEE